jgi:hypothetical protein
MAYGPSKRNNQTWYFSNLDTDSRLLNFKYFTPTEDGFMGSGTQNLAVMTSSRYAQTQVTQDHDKCKAQTFMMKSTDWRDVEITGQIKFTDAMEGAKCAIFARSGDITRPCEGTGYGIQLTPDGIVECILRQWYPGGETILDTNSGTAGDIEDKWIGFKVCIYNNPTDEHVIVQAWIDENNNNQFYKVCDTTDTGMGMAGERCGTNPNEIITWGGPLVVFNIVQCNDVFIRYFSVREIDPFNRYGIGGGITGEGFEIVNDITTLSYVQDNDEENLNLMKNTAILNRAGIGSSYASDGTVNSTLYQLTGRTQSMTIEGYKIRHYSSGKPDDVTREANTANGCPFADMEITAYITINNPDHDDTISFKMYGPSHEDDIGQWYISDLSFFDGQNIFGYEEPHPHTFMDINGSSIGSIVGKKIGYKTVIWALPGGGAHVQAWADKGDGLWVLLQEMDNPDGKEYSPDPDQKIQIRIDACPEIQYWDTPTVKEISPGGVFVGTGGPGGPVDHIDWTSYDNYDLITEISTTDSSTSILSTSTNDATGIVISNTTTGVGAILNGKIVNRMAYFAKGINTPTGQVWGVIWDENGVEIGRFGSSFDVAKAGTTTYDKHSFWDLNNTIPLKTGYRIGVEYTNPTGTDQYALQRSTASIDSSVAEADRPFGGNSSSWTVDATHDVKMQFYKMKDFSGGGSTAPIFPSAPSDGMKDYGGPKWSNATFYLIFWGSTWNTMTNPFSKKQVVDAVYDLLLSKYFDYLIQYGIKRPKIGKAVTNTTFPTPDNDGYTREDIWNVVNDTITRGLVPDNPTGSHNVYCVFAPKDAIDSTTGDPGVGAYHDYAPFPYAPTNATHIICWMPNHGYDLDQYIANTSHELVECIMDPIFSQAWGITGNLNVFTPFDNGTYLGYIEGCDVCIPLEVVDLPRISGHRVAYYWSNQDNRCVAPDSDPPWVSCPVGKTYDIGLQECIVLPGSGTSTGIPVNTNIILAPALTDNTIDSGGPKWSSPNVHFIFWGSQWNTRTAIFSKQQFMDKMTALFGSNYFDYLIQYGAKRPKIGKIVINTTYAVPSGGTFSLGNISQLIDNSIATGLVPKPEPYTNPINNHMYLILPPSPKIPDADQNESGNTIGYHFSISDLLNPSPTNITLYDVVGVATTHVSLDESTNVAAHELVEMMTNPVFNEPRFVGITVKKSFFPTTLDLLEIADVCETTTGTVNGVSVEGYYSDQDGGCVRPTAGPPWVSCHVGAKWNPITQACEAIPGVGGDDTGIPDWDDIGGGGGGTGGGFDNDPWQKAYTGGLGHLSGQISGKVTNGSVVGSVFGNISGVSGDSLATFAGTFTGTTPNDIIGQFSGNIAGTGTGTGNSTNGNKTGDFTADVNGTIIGIDTGSGVGTVSGKVTGLFTAINVVDTGGNTGTGGGTGTGGTGNTGGDPGTGTGTPTPDPATTSPTYVEAELQLLWAIDSMEGDPCSIDSPTEETSIQEIFNAPPDNLYAETLNYRMVGIYVNKISSVFVGKKIRNVKVIMHKVGASPIQGLVFCRIRSGNRTIVEEFPDTIDSSLISTTDVTYEFTHPSPARTIERGDFIYIEYPSGGDATNFLRIKLCDTDKADGEASCLVTFDGVNEVINIDKDPSFIVSI